MWHIFLLTVTPVCFTMQTSKDFDDSVHPGDNMPIPLSQRDASILVSADTQSGYVERSIRSVSSEVLNNKTDENPPNDEEHHQNENEKKSKDNRVHESKEEDTSESADYDDRDKEDFYREERLSREAEYERKDDLVKKELEEEENSGIEMQGEVDHPEERKNPNNDVKDPFEMYKEFCDQTSSYISGENTFFIWNKKN